MVPAAIVILAAAIFVGAIWFQDRERIRRLERRVDNLEDKGK